MACGGDTPDDLKAAMDVVVHVEIAEKESRSYPGIKGDDFRPYFRVLRDANYQGAINIEAKGTIEQLGGAVREVTKQAQDVMAELDRR
jgi:hydroxypyruvate isomerase